MPSDPEPWRTKTLGDMVRRYRLRQRQIHTGAPWAQEDLAVAIGSDKSHVNRIECGRSLPKQPTLERICNSLALSWQERTMVYAIAGYLLEAEPTYEEIEHVVDHAAPLVRGGAYSACLKDRGLRMWDVNDLFAYAFMGFPDRASCLAHVRGMRTVEELLDPRLSEWYQRTIVDFDAYVRRQLSRFLSFYRTQLSAPHLQTIVQRIGEHAIYGPIWSQIISESGGKSLPEFLDHQLVVVDHPHLGRYSVWIWHSSLTLDERFFVSHHVPADADSIGLIEHLAVRLHGRQPRIVARPRTSRATALS